MRLGLGQIDRRISVSLNAPLRQWHNNRHSLQFTINKIVYEIFGAISKDLYSEICIHSGIDCVENLAVNRRSLFIKRYGDETYNYLRQMLR